DSAHPCKYDGKSDPGATGAPRRVAVAAVEALKDASAILVADPRSLVGDNQLRVVVTGHCDADRRTGVGVLRRVADEVAHDALECTRIRPGHDRLWHVHDKLVLLAQRAHRLDELTDPLVERGGLAVRGLRPAVTDEVEKVVDEVGERPNVALHLVDGLATDLLGNAVPVLC